jgi:hypothetical protein
LAFALDLAVVCAASAQTSNDRVVFVVHGGIDDAKRGELTPADEQRIKDGKQEVL